MRMDMQMDEFARAHGGIVANSEPCRTVEEGGLSHEGNDRTFVVDVFIDLFIMALVIRKKIVIYRRRNGAAMNDAAYLRCMRSSMRSVEEEQGKGEDVDHNYLHFLERVRTIMSPGRTGSFNDFYLAFRRRMNLSVSLNFPFSDHYSITADRAYAESSLARATPRMRELAEQAADVYVAQVE